MQKEQIFPIKPLIAILGPTASGKTALAVNLAKEFDGEIISADSRQVYIGMDLGSGKEGESKQIEREELGCQPVRIIENIPQYLVDILPPTETFSVAQFQENATPLIENILRRNKLPFVTGGTNLYVKALTEGYNFPPVSAEEIKFREKLEKLSDSEILSQLEKNDPKSFQKIDHRNRRRLIRALSSTIVFGKPFSQLQEKKISPFQTLYLGIDLPRDLLYKNIDLRVDQRIKQGMIEEVQHLLDTGVSEEKLIAFGLEYRFITLYLTGKIGSQVEMSEKLKFATHDFARRQLIWLRHQLPVIWVKNEQEATVKIKQFLSS